MPDNKELKKLDKRFEKCYIIYCKRLQKGAERKETMKQKERKKIVVSKKGWKELERIVARQWKKETRESKKERRTK